MLNKILDFILGNIENLNKPIAVEDIRNTIKDCYRTLNIFKYVRPRWFYSCILENMQKEIIYT